MALGRELMGRGWTTAIASDGGIGNHSHGIDWFEAGGFRHYTVGFPKPDDKGRICTAAANSLLALERTVRQFQPDLIHVHYRATSSYAAIIQALHGIPFVSTLHMTGIPHRALHRLASFWGRRAIAISSEVRDYLKNEFRVNESRIRLVHNGADEAFFRPPSPEERSAARRKLGIANDTKVIAMVARMSREKGHDVLLAAMAKMRDEGKPILALMAGVSINGDRSWHEEVLRRAEHMGLASNVRALGFTDSRTVLWASDVSVLPSRQEGFPMAIVESMLCGLVTIRTPAAGAHDQITDGRDGFIIPFDDSEALCEKIRLAFRGDLSSSIGAAALAKARAQFSAGSMAAKTEQVYKEALAEARRF
jgi:glycosyltransferase involved in cell wall biosynthesis